MSFHAGVSARQSPPLPRSTARQPSAADKITGAINPPLFLLEGVAIAEVFTFLVLIMGGT